MKDVRVKIGRKVHEDERVAVIHKHRLWSSYELSSRDGLEKKIQLLYGSDRPFGALEGIEAFYTDYPDIPERRPDNYEQMSRQEQREWSIRWHKGQDYVDQRRVQLTDPKRRHYVAIVQNDGSFRIRHVIPLTGA